MSGPYLSSEDSALLRSVLSSFSGGNSLEIGAGNGGNLVGLTETFGRVVGTDLIRPGLSDWKGSEADYLLADAASCLRDGSFDLVAFNPPYLPVAVAEDAAVEGGTALEVPMRFLREALRTVKRTGRVVFLLKDDAPIVEFEKESARVGFALKKVATRHLFFEDLAVYEATAEETPRNQSIDGLLC